jgi:hypothetical protein
LGQCERQELIVCDVVLVLVVPTEHPVVSTEALEQLTVGKQSTAQCRKLVFALDVIRPQPGAENLVRSRGQQLDNEVEEARICGVHPWRARELDQAAEAFGELDHPEELEMIARQLRLDPDLELGEPYESDSALGGYLHASFGYADIDRGITLPCAQALG